MNSIFIALGAYWKVISIVSIVTIIFWSGYYLRMIQDESKIKKQLEFQILETNNKILNNSKVDSDYIDILKNIDILDITNKIGKSNEKDANCIIPDEWMHKLKSISH